MPLVGQPVIITLERPDGPWVVIRATLEKVTTLDDALAYLWLDDQPQGTRVVLPAKHLGPVQIDAYEPRDLRIEYPGAAVVVCNTSPLARLGHWRRENERTRSVARPEVASGACGCSPG